MLLLLITLYSFLFTLMAAAATLVSSLILTTNNGTPNLSMEEAISSIKAGISCGIPTGAGIWLSAKINEIRKNTRTKQ